MSTGMGHQNVVPKKLEIGMKVVVWLKPKFGILPWETRAGIKHNTWLRGEILTTEDRCYGIVINGEHLWIGKDLAITIRSVARQDNLKPHEIRAAARKQRRELMASVKIVRSEVR